MGKQKIAISLFSIFGIIAHFTPWLKLPIVGKKSGIQLDNPWITLFLFTIPIIICLIDLKKKELSKLPFYISITTPLVASIISISKLLEYKSHVKKIENFPLGKTLTKTIHIEYGVYILIACGLIIPLLAFLLRSPSDQSKAR